MRFAILTVLSLFLVNIVEDMDRLEPPPTRIGEPILAEATISDAIVVAAIRYDLPEPLLRAMAEVSSGTQPDKVAPDGSVGLFMIHPEEAGAQVYKLRGRTGSPETEELTSAYTNAEIAGEYLAWLRAEAYGRRVDPPVYVAAMHAGPTAIGRCMQGDMLVEDCLSEETRSFMLRVRTRVPADIWL